MKKAYITGATGCVGQNLLRQLIDSGWEVTALHRRASNVARLRHYPIKLQEIDFRDLDSVLSATATPADAIFHVAANLSHHPHEAHEQWQDNVLGTRYLVQASLQNGIRRFIHTSTAATDPYSWMDNKFAEKYIKPGYVRTKYQSELEIFKGVSQGLDAMILKPWIVLGPYDYNNYRKIFDIMKNGWFKPIFPGSIVFCHAEDVARGHIQAFEKGSSGEIYVLDGIHASWADLARRICRHYGVSETVHPIPFPVLKAAGHTLDFLTKLTGKTFDLTDDVVELLHDCCDVTDYHRRKVRTHLGYSVSRTLDETLDDYIRWHASEKERKV